MEVETERKAFSRKLCYAPWWKDIRLSGPTAGCYLGCDYRGRSRFDVVQSMLVHVPHGSRHLSLNTPYEKVTRSRVYPCLLD